MRASAKLPISSPIKPIQGPQSNHHETEIPASSSSGAETHAEASPIKLNQASATTLSQPATSTEATATAKSSPIKPNQTSDHHSHETEIPAAATTSPIKLNQAESSPHTNSPAK